MAEPQVAQNKNKDKSEWETVQRVIFPDAHDSSVWPLYIDWGSAPSSIALNEMKRASQVKNQVDTQLPQPLPFARESCHVPSNATRRSVTIVPKEHLSLATYFNAFPASYWQQWTDVKMVRLVMKTIGQADVSLLCSSVRGAFTKLDTRFGEGTMTFDVNLDRFGDGGWIWPEIEATHGEVTLVEAYWEVPVTSASPKAKMTIGITTFNLPDECVAQANRFAAEPEVLDRISQIVVVDQGTRHVVDDSGYSDVQALLGDKLRVIEQENLGGSGGFSRGMYEAVVDPHSQYVLLCDDDAQAEPEGVLRAISFAEHTYKPTIVGGHMLNLYERTVLHNMGEVVSMNPFAFKASDPNLSNIDFAQRTIRTDPLLNRRVDVSYNAWWMCLIPTSIVEEIGLSLPIFIKWDDVEYGLRASQHGYSTVTLPGMAAWHAPWSEKDDGNNWQSYFLQRNRWLVALLYSNVERAGRLPWDSLQHDLNHVLSYEYYAQTLRLRGLEDILLGPSHLFPSLLKRAQDARAAAAKFDDARLLTEPKNYPRTQRPRATVAEPHSPNNPADLWSKAIVESIKQLRPVDPLSREYPVEAVPSIDKVWWRLVKLDSALVSNSQGSGVWFYKRSRDKFVSQMTRSLRLHISLISQWDELTGQYRDAAKELTSIDSWKKIWGI